ncbi:MAG: FHA domain-containing protein [Candidatus Nanopelagicales bacterium]
MTGRGNTSQGSDAAAETATAPIKHPTVDADPARIKGTRVGTTHDVHGGGNPRLVPIFNDGYALNLELSWSNVPKAFPLNPGITMVGSDPASDIVLPRVAAHQAEVERDDLDEYRIIDTSPDQSSHVDGRPAVGQALHTGDRVTLGPWTFAYERAESADHGGPYGGHTGGLPHGYRLWQPTPRPRGTSASGGKEPTADDPGEYY